MAVVLMLSFSYLYIVIIHINSYFRLICLLLSSFVTSGALGVPSYFSFNFTWLDPLLSETGKQVFFRTIKVWTLVQHGSGRSSKQDRKRFLKLHKWASVAHEVLQFLIILSPFIATWSACQVCDFYLLKILHFRAMDFLVELFRNLLEHADWTMTQACTDSYTKTLKKFHGWLASSSFTVESFTLST